MTAEEMAQGLLDDDFFFCKCSNYSRYPHECIMCVTRVMKQYANERLEAAARQFDLQGYYDGERYVFRESAQSAGIRARKEPV